MYICMYNYQSNFFLLCSKEHAQEDWAVIQWDIKAKRERARDLCEREQNRDRWEIVNLKEVN